MLINSDKLVSISEVNQNFSKVIKLLEQHKSLVILKNNKPVYILLDYKKFKEEAGNSSLDIDLLAKSIIRDSNK
ncbi:MAG: type II toxin-antitoxin system Phd/YefM family antitoxin [Oscillospiraceae bacterium]|nr:type II toxin-antitoxin system Phd/YefM family antitoxin [Oscillospiraceae bacterium]